MIEVRTYEELDSWLNENNYFEDGSVPQITLDPLVISVEDTEGIGYKAYSKLTHKTFTITPINVIEWTCYEIPSSDHCIEEVGPVKVDKGVSLKIPYPLIQLTAEAFQISGPKISHSIVEPELDNERISIETKLPSPPTPAFWIEQFKNAGFDIVFRYYKGVEKPVDEVPYPNYTGYFFQLRDSLNESSGGIFIGNVRSKDEKVWMQFSYKEQKLQKAWVYLTSILADFPDVKLACGNLELTCGDWKKILESGKYPL